jgi:hypothetical protein
VGIETYPSPSIGTNRNSNLSSCFRDKFGSLSIADNRQQINIDGNKATLRGLESLGKEDPRWRQVEVRARRYLQQRG